MGDPILAVAAVDEKTAENALEKIKVVLEPLPFVVDPLDSLKPAGASARLEGNVYSRVREARQVLSQRSEDLENARRIAVEAGASTWNGLQTAQAVVISFQAEVRANEIALDGVQREALVGSRTVLDVLDAEQELLDANVNLVRSERNELVARFELKSAVGGLTARELRLPVEFYDAERNYRRVRNRWFGGDGSGASKPR